MDSTVLSTESGQYSAEYRKWTVKCRVQRVHSTVQNTESVHYSAEYREWKLQYRV